MTAVAERLPMQRPPKQRRNPAATEAVYRILSLVGALAIWEVLIWWSDVPTYFVPAPSDVAEALWRGFNLYVTHYLVTLGRTVTAFCIAVVIGIALGTLVSEIRVLNLTIYPILVALQSMPKIALAPVIIVWFGFGSTSKIVLGTFAAFFPIYLNAVHGLKTMDAEQLALMRSLGASRWQTFWKVKFPSALPFFLAGANIGIIYATLSVIVAEFLGSNSGMGFLIINQSNQFDTAGVFANILILSATGLAFHYMIQYLREKVIFWN